MKKLVLVVDDEPSIRKLLRRVCSVVGVDCIESCCVSEAIPILNGSKVDLVVCDLNMPGETGLQIIDHVRSSGSPIPVIIFSGSLTPAEEEKAIQMGANLVLCKPASVDVLRGAMSKYLDLG